MKSISEAQIAGYFAAYLDRNTKLRKTINRHFQGTIRSVDSLPGNDDGTAPYIVKITRTEGNDEQDYICALVGYIPAVGDLVECEWRDENIGYVKYPLRVVTQFGTASLGIASGTRAITLGVLFPTPYPDYITPVVFLAVQNLNATAAAERPVSAQAFTVTNTGFNISVDAFANVAALRTLLVAWFAIG